MHVLAAAFGGMQVAVGPATPSPVPTVDPQLVTPGPLGFGAIVFIALAVVFLVWDMQRRIRRTRYREEINDELDAEQAAEKQGGAAAEASEVDDESIEPGGPRD